MNSPRGQREPGSGIMQPSIYLSAEYCIHNVHQRVAIFTFSLGIGVLLARSGLGSRAFRSGFWSEPEPPAFGLFGLSSPIFITFKMTHIEAKTINICEI